MGSRSGFVFPDDDAVRALRNWLAQHPRAELSDLGDAFAQLDRSPSWRELGAAMELLGHRSPGGAPVFLADFVAHLAASRAASAVLDPFATSPTLVAALAERSLEGRAVALTPNESVAHLGRSVVPSVDWRVGRPFETLPQLEGEFDFIASTPPLGMRGGRWPVRPRLGEYANSLMVDVAERLTIGGAIAFLVADGFLFRADAARTQRELQARGLRVEAAISVEGGLRPQSEIPTSVILITRGEPLDDLFVGRLDSVTDPDVLIRNIAERTPGDFLQLGVLYPTGRYRGWRALLNERELLVGLGKARGAIAVLDDVAVAFVRLPDEEADPVHSIYMPEFPRAPVLIDPPEKPRGYTRIDLDPERANARWLAAWFNEPLGRTARSALASGATIERVRPEDLRRLTFPLPPVEEQAAAISVSQELQLVAGEVADARAGLWTGDLTVENAQTFLARVRGAFGQDPGQVSPAPTVEMWIEQLPFPLAGVGRMYLAVLPTREKVDHLQHFFEAYAIFIATALFSGVRRDAVIYQETVAKIRGGAQPRQSVLDRADFNTWINLGRTVAKRIRARLNGDKSGEIRATLFGSLPTAFIESLIAPEFWDVLDTARLVRNERGHSGVEGERWLKGKLARLEPALNDLRLLVPHAFTSIDLVRPGSAEQG